jgi:hypothetical protein
MRLKQIAFVTVISLLVAGCNGHAVLVERKTGAAGAGGVAPGTLDEANGGGNALAKGGSGSVDLGDQASGGSGGPSGVPGTKDAGEANCATNSNPEEGFTDKTLKLGTIIPVSGALRPLGEQTARVMKVSVEATMNRQSFIAGPYSNLNWGCPSRPGIYGRKVSLKIFSLQANTPEEALAGMRRLIDVENIFLVRDCYLQTSLMGPATQYQGSKGVPAIWCHFSEMPYPELAPWNFAPGADPQVLSALHTGYLIKKFDRQRLAILADPTAKGTTVRAALATAKYLKHPIPSDCVVYKRAQEAANGMRAEIAALRTCYGGQSPDAVVALDALNGVFGALEAKQQGWRPADSGVKWSCTGTSCWVTSLAELCGNACEGMLTDCATLPCVPFASPKKYPAVEALERTRTENFPQEPQDILTYAPAAITGGIALWLTMTGPDLSREKFRSTMENDLKNWSAGIGPVINITPEDHFGAAAGWLIEFTGRSGWFRDHSGGFLTLDDVGVPYSVAVGD